MYFLYKNICKYIEILIKAYKNLLKPFKNMLKPIKRYKKLGLVEPRVMQSMRSREPLPWVRLHHTSHRQAALAVAQRGAARRALGGAGGGRCLYVYLSSYSCLKHF